jgi:hypothetical protein
MEATPIFENIDIYNMFYANQSYLLQVLVIAYSEKSLCPILGTCVSRAQVDGSEQSHGSECDNRS